MKNILNKLAVWGISILWLVQKTLAAEDLPLKIPIPDGSGGSVESVPGGNGLLFWYFNMIYTYAIAISGSVAVVIILISAVRIITAGEDTGVIASSKERIFNCLIGIALLLFIGYILNFLNPYAFEMS